jgi:hypothetical protein
LSKCNALTAIYLAFVAILDNFLSVLAKLNEALLVFISNCRHWMKGKKKKIEIMSTQDKDI